MIERWPEETWLQGEEARLKERGCMGLGNWGSSDRMDSKYALEKHEGMTGNCSIFPKKNIFLYG